MIARFGHWMERRCNGAAMFAVIVAVGAASACGGGRTSTALFNDQGAATVACMAHQTTIPTGRYQPGPNADTESVFDVLHYYTANGNVGYCDGHGPSATDLKWLRLYVGAGADSAHVARNLALTPTR